MTMSWVDITIVIVLGVATVIGVKNGVIKTSLSLAGLIVGIILAGRYYGSFAERLTFISSSGGAKVAAFGIIFIGVMVIATLLARLAEKAASAIMLGWANHLGGAVLGFCIGAFFCGALLAIWVKYLGMSAAIAESKIAPILVQYFPKILGLLPKEFDSIRSFFQ
ncbi:MAG: CvpA family protein [Dehalococcoidales bacterium]|nr:CvpA family protein [Dehalococcoidales bacterium]